MTRPETGPTREAGQPLPSHVRPDGVSDATIAAVGKVSEALEVVEECRGLLYAFHRRTGTADATLQESVGLLRRAGHHDLADRIDRDLVGRNVIHGRWTFQLVEEYDDSYWSVFRRLDQEVRDELVDGRRHLYEAEMKEAERTRGDQDHAAVPDDSGAQGSRGDPEDTDP